MPGVSEGQSIRRTPIVGIVEKVAPAVVNISAEAIVRAPDPSGFVVEQNGVVVTNAHVIEGSSRILVTTADGQELEAEVLGLDRDTDIAVLKVDARDLASVHLGNSSDLLVGETVVALGNPQPVSFRLAVVPSRLKAVKVSLPIFSRPMRRSIPGTLVDRWSTWKAMSSVSTLRSLPAPRESASPSRLIGLDASSMI
jgi:S1-C subfamily serine protease